MARQAKNNAKFCHRTQYHTVELQKKTFLGCRRLADSVLIFVTGKSVHFLDEWHKRPTKGHS